MKRYFRFHSLRARILLLSLGFSALLALAAAFLTFAFSQRYLQESQQQSSIINLQILGGELDADLQRVELLADFIQIDPSIRNYLRTVTDPTSSLAARRMQALSSWNRLNNQFLSSGVRSSLNRAVVSVSDGKSFLQIMSSNGQPSNFNAQRLMAAPFFKPLYSAERILYQGLQANPLDFAGVQQIIPLIRPIRSSNSSRILGWMYLELTPELILRRMRSFSLPADAGLYVSIGEGQSYLYRDGTLLHAVPPIEALSLRLHTEGWALSLVPSRTELRPRQHYFYGLALLFSAAVLLLGSLLSTLLRREINAPVERLLARIEKTGGGDFSQDPEIEWDNELGSIGRGINALSENIRTLLNTRIQDEKAKKELEYRILQSQINPHFLYNTLNTVKWMASIQGAEGIAEISTALSRLLKNIAKEQRGIIALREEFHLVDDYFTIMKYRYGGNIELEYQIDEECLLLAGIHRFSLQPILENAIFHGIEPKGGAGKIRIHVCRAPEDADKLRISVYDDGIGMREEQIRRALLGTGEEENDFFRHIGVSNVRQRILYAFGEPYGLSIRSAPGSFTEVCFLLPLHFLDTNAEND